MTAEGWSDPFAFFGLESDATERDLKRAYARKLREHRPDRDPEGFRRVQEAYETALAWLAMGSRNDPYEPEFLEDDRSADESSREQQTTDGPVPEPESAPEIDRQQEVLAELRRILAETHVDDPSIAARLPQDANLLEAIRKSSDGSLYAYLALRHGATCATLAQVEPPAFALELVRFRIQERALHDRGLELVDELLEVEGALLAEVEFANDCAVLARVLVIENPQVTQRLEPLFESQASPELEDEYLEARRVAKVLSVWLGRNPRMAPLGRLLRFGKRTPTEEADGLLLELADLVDSYPDRFLAALDRLGENRAALEFIWFALCDHDQGEPREPSERARRRLADILRGKSGFWSTAYWSMHQPMLVLYSGILAFGGLSFWLADAGTQRWGLWIGRFTFPYFAYSTMTGFRVSGNKIYHRFMRKRILRCLVVEGAPTSVIDELMPGRRPLGSIKEKLEVQFNADVPIQIVGLILRLAAAIRAADERV